MSFDLFPRLSLAGRNSAWSWRVQTSSSPIVREAMSRGGLFLQVGSCDSTTTHEAIGDNSVVN